MSRNTERTVAGELIDLATQVGGGGAIGAVLTYLGFRLKTRSQLEEAYMSQLASQAARIATLEDKVDKAADKLEEERRHCDRRIADLRREFEARFDSITQPMYLGEPDTEV